MTIKIMEGIPFSEYEKILSPDKFRWLDAIRSTIERMTAVVCVDDDKIIRGYSVFLSQTHNAKEAKLLYIFVEEPYRDRGIATNILQVGVNFLKSQDYSQIMFSLEDETFSGIFERVGFKSLRTESKLIYSGEILFSSKVGKDLDKMNSYRQFVKKDDAGRERLFVDNKGNTLARMLTYSDTNGDIIVQDIIVDNEKAAAKAIPCLMIDLIAECKDEGTLKDETLLTIPVSLKNIDAMRQWFGEPFKILKSDLNVFV